MSRTAGLAIALALAWGAGPPALAQTAVALKKPFWTFESGHVRPLAVSPDGRRLFAVNTPDNRLEIYDVRDAGLAHLWSVPVGMEPVAVAARDGAEVWVVNHLSDSISIVDVAAVPPRTVRTLLVADEPRDIVFAGPGGNLAFVTTARRGQNTPVPFQFDTEGIGRALVYVFDADDLGSSLEGDPLEIIGDGLVGGLASPADELFGDTPRALAVSPDGGTVYAAVFHSGNRTTAITEQAVTGIIDSGLFPAIGPTLPAGTGPPSPTPVLAPATGEIVQNTADFVWVDDQGRNWGLFIRLDLPDQDVFAIDATASPPAVTGSFQGVGTVLFNMATNPASGTLYVSNSEANNLERFEGNGIWNGRVEANPSNPLFVDPNDPGFQPQSLRGHLHEARVTVIDPAGLSPPVPRHLNPHLVPYTPARGTPVDNAKSLATPLGMAISADGETLYLAAFGSSKIGVFNTAELEAGTFVPSAASHIELSEGGPSGVVLDEGRGRLYVLTRFGSSITVVDLSTAPGSESLVVPLPHDPEPAIVRQGRPFLYDARATSSNGEASCAGCHVFGRMDDLAWNLGDPDGAVVPNPNPFLIPVADPTFHPMKGPMTTQSLRGLARMGPMHWRGDRTGGSIGQDPLSAFEAFMAFNVAFPGLLGRSAQLDPGEMMAFTNFALELEYPPNPYRNLDNSETCEQRGGRTMYHGSPPDPGDPCTQGFSQSDASDGLPCSACHTLDPLQGFFGGNGASSFDGETQEFKIPHLRNAYQKVGMFGIAFSGCLPPCGPGGTQMGPHFGPQVRGFGYLHDGSIDTLLDFVRAPAFTFTGTMEEREAKRAKVVDFVMAFPTTLAPIVAQQTTLTSTNGGAVGPRIDLLIERALVSGALEECDLVAKGFVDGEARSWLLVGMDVLDEVFESDVETAPTPDTVLDADLRARVDQPDESLTYTCAPPGAGERMGLDRDSNGRRDGEECGDANADGVFGPSDPAHLARVLAGLEGLGSPRKCSVEGNPDQGDADGDGIPNDCTLLDRVVMQRDLAGLGPGVGQSCLPATL